MPQSITYQRQHIVVNKISTQKLLGNCHHMLDHVQSIHYQYNMEQELLTLSDHLLCWLWCLTMIFSQIRNTYIHPQFLRFALLTLQYSVLCFIDHCSSFSPFLLLVITLSVLPRFAPSDYRFWYYQTVLISSSYIQ